MTAKVRIEKNILHQLYLMEFKSLTDISKMTGIPVSTIRLRIIEYGLNLRSRKEGIQKSSHKLGAHLKGKKIVFTDEWKKNLGESIRNSSRVKNAKGTSLKPSGYIEYTTGKNKGRSAHVVKMEEHIGRKIKSNEIVHHKDEDKTNNEIENLELMTKSEHAILHATKNLPNRNRNNYGQFK